MKVKELIKKLESLTKKEKSKDIIFTVYDQNPKRLPYPLAYCNIIEGEYGIWDNQIDSEFRIRIDLPNDLKVIKLKKPF